MRTELVQIRMSPAEKALVVERAAGAGQTASEFLRGLGLGVPAPKKNRGGAPTEIKEANAHGNVAGLGSGPTRPMVRPDRPMLGAAELERDGGEPLVSGSAAPAVIPPSAGAAAGDGSGVGAERASVPGFRCPWDSCDYRAKSPRVSCPVHGRKVIPA